MFVKKCQRDQTCRGLLEIMKIKNKERTDDHDIERYTIKSAIEKIKNGAKTNIILIMHMENLTIEQKLYLAYFWGTREGKMTILDFEQ